MAIALSQLFLASSNCLSTYFGKSKLLLGHCVFGGANKDDMRQMSPEFPVSFFYFFFLMEKVFSTNSLSSKIFPVYFAFHSIHGLLLVSLNHNSPLFNEK